MKQSFNTSYITINQTYTLLCRIFFRRFNTSYITINQVGSTVMVVYPRFNTSYITINLRAAIYIRVSTAFQYILYYY